VWRFHGSLIKQLVNFYLQIRNHKINRLLDDPVLQLSTISDDNRLAVYRLPKLEKRANYIQFVHRFEDM
jgi:hypothetical protein